MSTNHIDQIVQAQKRGETRGIYSICSAHPVVLEAAMRSAGDGDSLLIESTCNQVNQDGGYTGMKPSDFLRAIQTMADKVGFSRERLIFGGDHLGPLPWRNESGTVAMEKAKALVLEYVLAGYTKIHLDASVPCKNDKVLSVEQIASRTAELAKVAELEGRLGLRYVVGSEVPTAGGAYAGDGELVVTSPTSALETLKAMIQAFYDVGLESAWDKVIGLVVQPGVEFGDQSVHPYEREKAAGLKKYIEGVGGIVYEAHSTDYQDRVALRQLVEDHFAVLKVGPALTFAFREGSSPLKRSSRSSGFEHPSRIGEVLEEAMLANPAYWEQHYRGDEVELRPARRYSFSDRIRYYWAVPAVQSSLSRLLANLETRPIPLSLLIQFIPMAISRASPVASSLRPRSLLTVRVHKVLDDYGAATQLGGPPI